MNQRPLSPDQCYALCRKLLWLILGVAVVGSVLVTQCNWSGER